MLKLYVKFTVVVQFTVCLKNHLRQFKMIFRKRL